jgi:hypothetical protein
MGNANRACEEESNLLGDLPRGRPKPRPASEFDEIPFNNWRFSKKRFIKWLTKLEAYFYFNKVPYQLKVGFIVYKLSCGAREWWFESLDFKILFVCI